MPCKCDGWLFYKKCPKLDHLWWSWRVNDCKHPAWIWMRAQSDGWSRMQSPVCQRGGFLRHGLMLEQLLAKHSPLASVAIMMAGGRWWSSSLRWSPIWDGISWGECVFYLITILIFLWLISLNSFYHCRIILFGRKWSMAKRFRSPWSPDPLPWEVRQGTCPALTLPSRPTLGAFDPFEFWHQMIRVTKFAFADWCRAATLGLWLRSKGPHHDPKQRDFLKGGNQLGGGTVFWCASWALCNQ